MPKFVRVARAALLAAALSGAVSGYAKSPSSIAPVAIASSEYSALSCTDARIELTRAEASLADATRRQNNAQAGDAIGVFLILIPFSALTGDAESDVAQFKGEKLALERAIDQKKCGSSADAQMVLFPSVEERDKFYDSLIVRDREDTSKNVSAVVSQCGSVNSEECQAAIKALEDSRDARIAAFEAMRARAKIGS